MTIDPDFKAKWVAALRSGDYKQGSGVLHQINNNQSSFCCLGVACEVAGVPWGESEIKGNNAVEYIFDPEGGRETTVPFGWGNLDRDTVIRLIDMNDGDGHSHTSGRHTFAEIADWIEENL